MVLPILIALIAAPALLGTQEAIRQSQSKEKREEHRARRCNLIASCVKSSLRSREINGRPIVLRDGKLWVDTGTSDGSPYGHPYAGYYLPYPDSAHEGLVTTITDVAPIMNWVYVDKDSHEVKYGVRLDAQPHLTGPFDCTRQDRRLTFDGWEGWCAVEEAPGRWALYFDRDDDGLRTKVAEGTRVLELELSRKEKRWQKDGEERRADQTTQRAVETKGAAPVDTPVTKDPELAPPGVGVPDEKASLPLRPFGMPKSIFSDPPRPLFWSEETQVPMEPPPAYYQKEEGEAEVEEIVLPFGPGAERAPPLSTSRPKTPPQKLRDVSPPERQYRESAFETPRRAPAPPANQAPKTPPPQKSLVTSSPGQIYRENGLATPGEITPTAPAPLKVSPPTEKRPTPKLNRMSGTRAMSQAQMFEAWATGQTPKNESMFKKPKSRPTSNATSVSNSSDSARVDEDEILKMYGELGALTPAMMEVGRGEEVEDNAGARFEVSDPAVFARLSSGSSTGADPAVVKKKKVVGRTSIERKTSTNKAPLPRSAPLNRRQGSTSTRNRDTSPNQQRRPGTTASRDATRSTRQATRPTPSPVPRDRNTSVSSQPRTNETPRPFPPPPQRANPPLRRGERPSPRPLTRTNTAPPVRNAPDRSRTTSSLFREIDDMVGAGRERSGSAASSASSSRRNASRNEDREGPALRRAGTAREPGSGVARRDERGPERRY